MKRSLETTKRLRAFIQSVMTATTIGELTWERQVSSAHRFARWKNVLMILGPDSPLTDLKTPRYLFLTPFDSPDCVEISSDDDELGDYVLALTKAVETLTRDKSAVDPFSINADILERLEG